MKLSSVFAGKKIGSQREKDMDAVIAAVYRHPSDGSVWLFTEADKQENGDWLMYGYCRILIWEWGYVLRSQLPEKVKYDASWNGKTVREYMQEVYKDAE